MTVTLRFSVGKNLSLLSIPLYKGEDVTKLLKKIIKDENLPIYLLSSFHSSLSALFLEEIRHLTEAVPSSIITNSTIINEALEHWDQKIRDQVPSWLKDPVYSQSFQFTEAYRSLMLSGEENRSTLFQLEASYALAVQQVIEAQAIATRNLDQRHIDELRAQDENAGKVEEGREKKEGDLKLKQEAEKEALHQKWQNEIRQVKHRQKQEYLQFVLAFHNEPYPSSSNSSPSSVAQKQASLPPSKGSLMSFFRFDVDYSGSGSEKGRQEEVGQDKVETKDPWLQHTLETWLGSKHRRRYQLSLLCGDLVEIYRSRPQKKKELSNTNLTSTNLTPSGAISNYNKDKSFYSEELSGLVVVVPSSIQYSSKPLRGFKMPAKPSLLSLLEIFS
eukprot:TRINITY_DN1605_c0_g1_i1.p1 TRINITY_DN1605_c0_g1~~TRINITY_DN1605_c0_g1_i1.p1  ORF type:complete len:405 (-),score=106.58 TRINITY_DN1605_c0_g1_i1:197-1360(-)